MYVANIEMEAIEKISSETLNIANIAQSMRFNDSNKIYEVFNLDVLEKFSKRLIHQKEYIPFDVLWQYRPEYASCYLYNTASYDYLILHANNMKNKKDFIRSNFIQKDVAYYPKNALDEFAEYYKTLDKKQPQLINQSNYLLYRI